MVESWDYVNEAVHNAADSIEAPPERLDPALVLRISVIAIEAPRHEVRSLNQTTRARIREHWDVCKMREFADSACHATPRIDPTLNVFFHYAAVVNDNSLLVNAGRSCLTSQHLIKLVEHFLICSLFPILIGLIHNRPKKSA